MREGSLQDRESLDAKGLNFAVVAARWNSDVTDRLLDGALGALRSAGADDRDVPACRWEARPPRSAVVSLGCLIRGETPHFEFLAHSVASALAHLNAAQDVPIAFGVLTCDSREQAMERSGGASGNAGAEAAQAAIAMANLRRPAVPERRR